MKKSIKIGDIFSIPINDTYIGYGQVVEIYEKVLVYCVFYAHSLEHDPRLAPSEILFAGITARIKIQNGDWSIIGNNVSNINQIKRPHFKVIIDEQMHVVSFSGNFYRKIKDEEADILTFRTIIAPIRYENALRAHFGTGEWLRTYDKLLYTNVIRSNEISLKPAT